MEKGKGRALESAGASRATPPRSARKRRRLDGGGSRAGIEELSARTIHSTSPVIPPTPPFVSSPPPPSHSAPRTPASAPDTLAHQIFTLYTRLDDLSDDLSRSYDAERRARMESHNAAQRQLAGMQGLLEDIAWEYARMRRRRKMHRGLFGAGASASATPVEARGGSYSYEGDDAAGMTGVDMSEMDLDVDVSVVDCSQPQQGIRRESSETVGRSLSTAGEAGLNMMAAVGGIQASYGDDGGEGGEYEEGEVVVMEEEEREEEGSESSASIPLPPRRRLRRRIITTSNSPAAVEDSTCGHSPTRRDGDGNDASDEDEPAADSEPYSLRALKRSLELGIRNPQRRRHHRRTIVIDSQSQGQNQSHSYSQDEGQSQSQSQSIQFSQVSIPPNPEDAWDDTYHDGDDNDIDIIDDITTTTNQPPPTSRPRNIPQTQPARPRRASANVKDYYEWDRYIIRSGGTASSPDRTARIRPSNPGAPARSSRSPRQLRKQYPSTTPIRAPPAADISSRRIQATRRSMDLEGWC
ncbi:hypothetical protein DRE_04597 [Drechslerella stenobrocha 248]|uniref:Uncharacterized protein n=1 Tax=Drechslerella stenobrocha 248 TaxID=1043628 RepID=W7HSJ9_9PEZI|nr:hypothetical protein DRE_04597 [Drechslerella stenobrocha 248]